MTTASHILDTNTATARESFRTPLQMLAGFFFAYRFCLTYLGFQSNPRLGTITILACSALLFIAALIYTVGDEQFSLRALFASRTLRWLFAYLLMSGLSLFYTAAASITDAVGQWVGMATEVAIVLLLVKRPNTREQFEALMKGFVVGMLFVGAVAWLSPTMSDLRIGDEEFLHPNVIGMYCALAFFLAQYLALEEPVWRWCCLALGITLLRSISKTSIIAFLLAESFYLLREKQMPRAMKIKIAAVAAILVAAFGTLLDTYLEAYTTAGGGTQTETLTGRTAIWATSFLIAIERPWIGHGFYSFRALIPSFGIFEPRHAHNELLQQFFEFGLMGIIATVGLYLFLTLAAKRESARRYRGFILVVVLFSVIHGLTETVNFGLTIPFWLFAAFAVALEQPEVTAT